MWQVYVKKSGHWLPVGDPTSEQKARADVDRQRAELTPAEFRNQEPHCVRIDSR